MSKQPAGSLSELRARVCALEVDLQRERAARRAAERASAEAVELRREVAALQHLVHMSTEGRIAYAERQRRRTGLRAVTPDSASSYLRLETVRRYCNGRARRSAAR